FWTFELVNEFLTSVRNNYPSKTPITMRMIDAFVELKNNTTYRSRNIGSNVLDCVTAFRYTAPIARSFGRIIKRNEQGTFGIFDTYPPSAERLLESGMHEIFSVKNSQGEEFKIGDTVVRIRTDECVNPSPVIRKIKSFYIDSIGVKPDVRNVIRFSDEYGSSDAYMIDCFTHSEEERVPLFMINETPIYDGEMVWFVAPDDEYIAREFKITRQNFLQVAGNCYLTKYAAEQFIKENKPSISYRDLEGFVGQKRKDIYPNIDGINLLKHFHDKLK